MTTIVSSIVICLAAFVSLLLILRRNRQSLGLPIAYLFLLLLNHIPGAIAHATSSNFFDSTATEIGVWLTAIGAVFFIIGVGLLHLLHPKEDHTHTPAVRRKYWFFCLVLGWVATYMLARAASSVGLGVVVDNAGMIWLLGIMLGLRAALSHNDLLNGAFWMTTLMVYPSSVLLFGGFLSYGSAAIIIGLSVCSVCMKSNWRVVIAISVVAFLGFNCFLSYFVNRTEIRAAVWGGATLEERLDRVSRIFTDFELFDPSNSRHLAALDARLNQNHFVGLAVLRLDQGTIDYRYGETFWHGILQLIPRVIWPEKPSFGGSNDLVAEMTGLKLSRETSWGVGNVLEFYVNFGMTGIVL